MRLMNNISVLALIAVLSLSSQSVATRAAPDDLINDRPEKFAKVEVDPEGNTRPVSREKSDVEGTEYGVFSQMSKDILELFALSLDARTFTRLFSLNKILIQHGEQLVPALPYRMGKFHAKGLVLPVALDVEPKHMWRQNVLSRAMREVLFGDAAEIAGVLINTHDCDFSKGTEEYVRHLHAKNCFGSVNKMMAALIQLAKVTIYDKGFAQLHLDHEMVNEYNIFSPEDHWEEAQGNVRRRDIDLELPEFRREFLQQHRSGSQLARELLLFVCLGRGNVKYFDFYRLDKRETDEQLRVRCRKMCAYQLFTSHVNPHYLTNLAWLQVLCQDKGVVHYFSTGAIYGDLAPFFEDMQECINKQRYNQSSFDNWLEAQEEELPVVDYVLRQNELMVAHKQEQEALRSYYGNTVPDELNAQLRAKQRQKMLEAAEYFYWTLLEPFQSVGLLSAEPGRMKSGTPYLPAGDSYKPPALEVFFAYDRSVRRGVGSWRVILKSRLEVIGNMWAYLTEFASGERLYDEWRADYLNDLIRSYRRAEERKYFEDDTKEGSLRQLRQELLQMSTMVALQNGDKAEQKKLLESFKCSPDRNITSFCDLSRIFNSFGAHDLALDAAECAFDDGLLDRDQIIASVADLKKRKELETKMVRRLYELNLLKYPVEAYPSFDQLLKQKQPPLNVLWQLLFSKKAYDKVIRYATWPGIEDLDGSLSFSLARAHYIQQDFSKCAEALAKASIKGDPLARELLSKQPDREILSISQWLGLLHTKGMPDLVKKKPRKAEEQKRKANKRRAEDSEAEEGE